MSSQEITRKDSYNDECDDSGLTASITHGSETIFSCDDHEIVRKSSDVSTGVDDDADAQAAGDASPNSDHRGSEVTVEYIGSLDINFDEAEDYDSREGSDDVSPLNVSTASPKSSASMQTEKLEHSSQQQQLQSQDESIQQYIVSPENDNTSTNKMLLSELDHIESKIKAAIDHNHQIRSNSVEMETVLRKSTTSGRVDIPPELDSLCHCEHDPLDVSYEKVWLSTVSLDDTQSSSAGGDAHIQHENQILKQQLASIQQDLVSANEARAQEEQQHNSKVKKLKRQLSQANKLVRRLQTKKLSDMENNFMASIDLLEAKLSEEINNEQENDMEERLAAMKSERDTARELNLPLFNDLKKLYEIKAMLEQRVDELLKDQQEQREATAVLEERVRELLDSEKELLQKAKDAEENTSKLSTEVSSAHDEIARLKSELEATADDKELQIKELKMSMLNVLREESIINGRGNISTGSTSAFIQQLQHENSQLTARNKELESENLSHKEENALLRSEEDDLRLKLEALRSSMELQLKEKDERISDLESKQYAD